MFHCALALWSKFCVLKDHFASGNIPSLLSAHFVLDDAWEMQAWSSIFSTKAHVKHRTL